MKELQILPQWEEAAQQIEKDKGAVLILGAPDSGKTTLAKFLLEYWVSKGRRIGLVDSDIGQSLLGPPTTIGLAIFDSLPPSWEEITPLSIHFVGSVSPNGHLLPMLVACKRMVEKSWQLKAEITLVDTTGLVFGSAARELKFRKIELISPKHLLVLQKNREIEHLLLPYLHQEAMIIHRLPASSLAKVTSREERKAFREKRLGEYFKEVRATEISLKEVGTYGLNYGLGKKLSSGELTFLSKVLKTPVFHGEKEGEALSLIVSSDFDQEAIFQIKAKYGVKKVILLDSANFQGLLLGLNDQNNNTLALGILKDLDFKKERLSFLAPLLDPTPIKLIQFGSLRVGEDGKELGREE